MRRAVVLTVVLAACGSTGGDDDAATEVMVLETCAPGGDDPIDAEVCECAYDEVRDRLGPQELEDLDRRLRDDPETVPASLQQVVLECAFAFVAPPTVKVSSSTTTVASSTTTTAP